MHKNFKKCVKYLNCTINVLYFQITHPCMYIYIYIYENVKLDYAIELVLI